MKMRVTLTASFLLLLSTAAVPQENALESIDISVTQEMVDVATRLIASVRTGTPQQGDRDAGANRVERMVGYSREDMLNLSATDEAKRDWVYWPRNRVGLTLEYMTAEQRVMVHELLNALLSSQGYLKAVHIMQHEEILSIWEEVGLPRGKEKYWLSFFGMPSMEEAWGWRFEGHHVSLNVSIAAAGLRVTPTFFGADPAEVPQGALAGFRPLAGAEDTGRDLVLSLTPEQREIAILSDVAPNEIFATNLGKSRDNWDAWRETLQPQGIAVADLSAHQRQLVQRILDEVITTYRPEISDAYLKTVDVDDLSFAWMGSLERRIPHYYRLQGSDFMFEYDNAQDNGNHVHTVWRSKSGDFGDDLLQGHYQTSHR